MQHVAHVQGHKFK